MKETVIDTLTQQQQRLTTIGAHLHEIRTAKGWSLVLTARKTRIRTTLLKYIEAGTLESLPEPVYLQGLIRCYADSLGLDGAAIAKSFPIEDLNKQWQLPRWANFAFQFQLRPAHLYLIYFLVIVTTVQSLSNIVRTPSTALDPALKPEAINSATPTASRNQSPAAKLVNAAAAPRQQNPASDQAVVIDIKAQETSWMRVEIDGKTAFEGTLPKGTEKQWVADETVKIRAGNAGAVYITINNETPHPLGQPGEVEEFTYQALAGEKPDHQVPS